MHYDYDALADTVRKIKEGDMASFRLLYDKTQRQIYYLALKILRNKEEAEDILQDTYISAYKHIQNCKNDRAVVSWLTTIAYNHIRDRQSEMVKKNKVFIIETEDNEMIYQVADTTSIEDDLISREDEDMILALIDTLPEKQRSALYMYYFQGLTAAEIAEACGCNENLVYKRLFDARQTIKKKLTTDGRREQR